MCNCCKLFWCHDSLGNVAGIDVLKSSSLTSRWTKKNIEWQYSSSAPVEGLLYPLQTPFCPFFEMTGFVTLGPMPCCSLLLYLVLQWRYFCFLCLHWWWLFSVCLLDFDHVSVCHLQYHILKVCEHYTIS